MLGTLGRTRQATLAKARNIRRRHQRQRDATSFGNRQIQLLRPRRRTRRAPTDRAARFIDDRSHSVSGRFSISTTRGQHHVPSSTLDALRDEKASSGLPLQPTDLPSLLTEQIAHFSPLLETAPEPINEDCHNTTPLCTTYQIQDYQSIRDWLKRHCQ